MRVVAGQPAISRQRLPVSTFGRYFGAGRIGRQALAPALPGTALAPQIGNGAHAQLRVGTLQVIEQEAPGNAIDHQVVDHQQQALAAFVQLHQHGAQQWATAQIEAGLHLVAQRAQLGQAAALEAQFEGFGLGRIALAPAVALLLKTQA